MAKHELGDLLMRLAWTAWLTLVLLLAVMVSTPAAASDRKGTADRRRTSDNRSAPDRTSADRKGTPRKGVGQQPAKVRCAQAAEAAQQYRIEGKLLEEREQLHVCLELACPAVVRSYCARWFEEVEAALPSVVLRVHDHAGNDLLDASVRIDGVLVEGWRDGLPIPLDPGEHIFAYQSPSAEPLELKVLLGTGEKNRVVKATLTGSSLAQSSEQPEDTQAFSSTQQGPGQPSWPERWKPSTAAWVTGGVAVAAWGSFAYFGLSGRSELQELRRTCEGECASSEVDRAWTKLVVADVSLGVAAVATGVATWLFVASTRRKERRSTGLDSTLAVVPSRTGAGLHWSARF